MTLSRSTVLGSAGLVILAGVLYLAKTEAERVRDYAGELERQLVAERKAVRILEAELVWRAGPQRLEAAAQAAGLVPIDARQVITLAEIDAALAGSSGQKTPVNTILEDAPQAAVPVAEPVSTLPVAEADQ